MSYYKQQESNLILPEHDDEKLLQTQWQSNRDYSWDFLSV